MAENSCQPLIDSEGSEFGGSWACVPLPPECQAVGVPARFSGFESPPRCWPSGCKLKWIWGRPDDVDLTWLWEAAGWAPHQQCHSNLPRAFRLQTMVRSHQPRQKTPAGSITLLKPPVCDPAVVPRSQRSPICEVG